MSVVGNSELALSLERRDLDYDSFDVLKQACAIGFAQSAMIGDKIYIEGGFMWYKDSNDTNREGPNMWLRVLDTSKSFLVDRIEQVPLEFRERPEQVPETSGGDLWAYDDKLYLRPGYMENSDRNWPGYNRFPNGTVLDIWRYDTKTSSWDPEPFQHNPRTTTGDLVPRIRHPLTVSIPSLKKAYVIGGEDDHNGGFNKGMLVYDFEDETWTKQSTSWTTNWASGLAVHVPAGGLTSGYIVAFAGRSRDDNQLNRIEIFDLSLGSWRTTQLATAAEERFGLPPDRQKPCSVMAQAKDGSSYNIYVFGGIDLSGSSPYNDVWVLSIPSFRWILVNTGRNQDAPQGLESMSCNIVGGGRKMMVYGGRHVHGNQGAKCERTGTHVFDLTTLQWETTYEPKGDEYEVPEAIYKVIGGGPEGGATLLPELGFSNSEMEKKFEMILDNIQIQNGTSTPSPSSTPTTSNSPNESTPGETTEGGTTEGGSKLSAGAIAGIVIGAIFGITLIALILLWFLRWRRKSSGKISDTPAEMATTFHSPGQLPLHVQSPAPPQELYSSVPSEMPVYGQNAGYEPSHGGYYEPKNPDSPPYQTSTADAYQPQDQHQTQDQHQPQNQYQTQDQHRSHDQYQSQDPYQPQDHHQPQDQYRPQDHYHS